MSTQIQIRRDSEANWTSVNPILADGEIGFDVTSNRVKVGNGVDAWNDIEFSGASVATGEKPVDPDKGDQWFDEVNGILLIWNGSEWITVGGGDCNIPILDSPPANPELGEQWFSSTDGYLYIWYGSEWVAIGGAGGGDGGGGTDDLWIHVHSLINGDGQPDGSTQVVDATNKNSVTNWNAAKISTTDPKYGTGCVSFDGSNMLEMATPSPDNFYLGEGFTVEMWVKASQLSTTQTFACQWTSGGAFIWIFNITSAGKPQATISLNGYNGSPSLTNGTESINVGQWHHIALTWDKSRYRLFVDGVESAGADGAVPFSVDGNPIVIGGKYSQIDDAGSGVGATQHFEGEIDDFRLTERCRYRGNFTPPEKMPTSGTRSIVKYAEVTKDVINIEGGDNDADLS